MEITMKIMKKMFALLAALVMAVGMSAVAFAADVSISAPAGSTRSYEVYQIFTGDLSGTTLSNVKWGTNGTGTTGTAVDSTVLDALTAVNSKSDTEKLAVIEDYWDSSVAKIGTVSDGNPLSVPTGYYLIKDVGPVNDGEAYSLYVVAVVGPTTISPKTGTTTSEKKVKDTNDSTANSTTDWQDSADYDIGDSVPFQLKATIASDYANYTTYKLTFHDVESTGLTFNDDAKVYVDGVQITSGYTVSTTCADGDTFEVIFTDLKTIASVHAGSVITVEYTSKLNENAVLGSAGNPNTMHITYSNNPNDKQGGENGKTPDDKVIVFTYKLTAKKVDENKNALTGAGFTLYKKNAEGTYVAVGEEVTGEAMSTFSWTGLDDGDYKLSETKTPAGYNTMADLEFTISATHTDGDAPALTTLTGGNTFTGNVTTGELTGDIINYAGSTLPSTGGIGTRIFYIVGGILAAGALILLIAKRRMRGYEE